MMKEKNLTFDEVFSLLDSGKANKVIRERCLDAYNNRIPYIFKDGSVPSIHKNCYHDYLYEDGTRYELTMVDRQANDWMVMEWSGEYLKEISANQVSDYLNQFGLARVNGVVGFYDKINKYFVPMDAVAKFFGGK
jgi:hypothetical protein